MRTRLLLVGVVAAMIVLPACGEESPSILDARGSEAERIAGVWWLMFGLAAGVYVVVAGLIFYGAFRGRKTEGGRPARFSDNAFIVAGGVLMPVVILSVLAVATVHATTTLRQPVDDELTIEVTGKRWWWEVRYPDSGIVTANEIHVPVGRPLHIRLLSDNILHSFWVPQLAGKVDTVPGQVNHLRFTVREPGVYLGECAEYCGLQHARMQFLVVAEDGRDFERWRARHLVPPTTPAGELEAMGQRVFMREACAGCHTIRGTDADGELGPDLTDIGSRRTLGAGAVPNTPGHLAGWILDSQSIKPGNLMPRIELTPAELDALLAYLESLK